MKIIKFYPYRKARVRGITVPRDLMRSMEEELHKQAGSRIDNHVCFSVMDEHWTIFHVMFHDCVCVIGRDIIEGDW